MISIQTKELQNLALKLHNSAENYEQETKKLYEIVNAVSQSWKGLASNATIDKINSYEDEIRSLGFVINDYAVFLSKCVAIAQKRENDIIEDTGNL